MSVAMHLNIGGVEGASTDPGWTGAIDVLSFSWGGSNSGTATGTPGRTNLADVSVQCLVDTATAALIHRMARGYITNQMTLTVSYTSPASTDTYRFSEILVSSVNFSGSEGGGDLVVSYSFNYAAIDFTISGKHTSWDVRTPA